VRNSTATPTTFEQWLADRAAGVIAAPVQRSGDGLRADRAPRFDKERLTDLASDILADAIKLLEAVRQGTVAPMKGGYDHA
jgi:hypothetical protein